MRFYECRYWLDKQKTIFLVNVDDENNEFIL